MQPHPVVLMGGHAPGLGFHEDAAGAVDGLAVDSKPLALCSQALKGCGGDVAVGLRAYVQQQLKERAEKQQKDLFL